MIKKIAARMGLAFGTGRCRTLLLRLGKGMLALFVLLALGVLIIRLMPKMPLQSYAPSSTAIYSADGQLLRLMLSRDDKYRLWVPLERISPQLRQAVLLYEDRWFYRHPGVNPAALLRAAAATYSGGTRQGASTVTMQLARLIDRLDTRSIGGKVRQIGRALWLEAAYSKDEIFEAYLNLAPYGGNVEGVGAASLIYFHERVQTLPLPQALTLAVIPQSPARRTAVISSPETSGNDLRPELRDARRRLFERWQAQYGADASVHALMLLPLKLYGSADLPREAPHLTDHIVRLMRGKAQGQMDNKSGNEVGNEIYTALSLPLQRTLERQIKQTIASQRMLGVNNACAMLVDVRDGSVRALVGSADFADESIDGQVNGTLAKRSPGSTLKPFIYGLALDQGVLHPATILRDAPTRFGPFNPENFDGRFVGPVSAQDALVRSRNVPAVAVAARLAGPNLYGFLKMAGIAQLKPEKHYGLALTLGGGEISMEELAGLYAMLGNQGRLRPLAYLRDEAAAARADEEPHLLSPEASYVVLDMLAGNPRPDTGVPAPANRPVSWKTGTSWGFRDAWTVGNFGPYVLAVWIGNFDGAGNPAFIGVEAAAPLFFRIVDSIRAQGLDPGSPDRPFPRDLIRLDVCAASGDLPNAECPRTVKTWFIPGKSPIRTSTVHRTVYIDERTGRAVCQPGEHTRAEVFEFWSSDMQKLFRETGMPRTLPPPLPAECATPVAAGSFVTSDEVDPYAPKITTPLRGVTYRWRADQDETLRIPLLANLDASTRTVFWFADDAFIGRVRGGETLSWQPPGTGNYQLRAVDEAGRASTREVRITVD